MGEAPISISGEEAGAIEHTIRGVGAVTKALCALEEGVDAPVEHRREALEAGTNCGSCKPEIAALIAEIQADE